MELFKGPLLEKTDFLPSPECEARNLFPRATYIGFASIVIENVTVAENLTTEVDFTLLEQTIEGEEIVVTAEQPVVKPDVSASVTSIQAQEIASLPVTDVASVIGLGAGIRGTSVRGVLLPIWNSQSMVYHNDRPVATRHLKKSRLHHLIQFKYKQVDLMQNMVISNLDLLVLLQKKVTEMTTVWMLSFVCSRHRTSILGRC